MASMTTASTPSATPSAETLSNCFKFSLEDDKPILTDYWQASLEKQAQIKYEKNSIQMTLLNFASNLEY